MVTERETTANVRKRKGRPTRENKAEAICMQMKHESQIYGPSISNTAAEESNNLLCIHLDPARLCQWRFFFVMET